MFGLRPHYERMLRDNPLEVAGGTSSGGGSSSGSSGGGVYQPPIGTYEAWQRWNQLGRPGGDFWQWFNSQQQASANQGALGQISDLLQRYPGAVQIADTLWRTPSGIVLELTRDESGAAYMKENGAEQSRAILKNLAATGGGSGGSGSGGSAGTDPRYWQLQYDQLASQYMNMGLDAESARRQALTTLITNRNNTAVDAASLSANIAKQKADYMANPRDSFAELYYANQVGGSTPFGDISNPDFQNYSAALREKGDRMFTDVNSDLQQLRTYRDAIPPVEFYGPETRQQLGVPPSAAQALTGGTSPALPAVDATAPNPLQAMMDRLEAMSPTEQWDFRNYTTGGEYGKTTPRPMAKGGQINFDSMWEGRSKPGFSPASSEGGTNLNIHERAIVVGESGQVYATLGERRPDGTMRAEQLQIKPLKSEVEKDKKLADGDKAVVESQKQTMAAFAEGGAINATPTPDDLMEQLSIYLKGLGGSGGGTGFTGEGLADPRLLAGAPWAALQGDRRRMEQTYSGYSAMPYGIDPMQLEDTVKKFTPRSPYQQMRNWVTFA